MEKGLPLYTDGNDDEPEATARRKNSATGAKEPATGLVGLKFRLAAAAGGAAIHANLDVAATERGTTGIYAGVFQGSDLQAQLGNATYWDKDVVQIFGNGADVNYSVVRRVLRYRP